MRGKKPTLECGYCGATEVLQHKEAMVQGKICGRCGGLLVQRRPPKMHTQKTREIKDKDVGDFLKA